MKQFGVTSAVQGGGKRRADIGRKSNRRKCGPLSVRQFALDQKPAHKTGRSMFGHQLSAAPKSSSASSFTAGAFGFFTLTQCAERPDLRDNHHVSELSDQLGPPRAISRLVVEPVAQNVPETRTSAATKMVANATMSVCANVHIRSALKIMISGVNTSARRERPKPRMLCHKDI
jgi:hypothetical protein